MRALSTILLILVLAPGCRTSPAAKEAKYLRRGRDLLAKKDFARALLEFANAQHVMPKDPEPYYQSGLTYLAMGNGDRALPAFFKVIELNPKHPGAQLKLAEIMTAARRKDLAEGAVKRLQSLLADAPDNLEAIETLALAEVELGQPEQAAARLEQALQKFPGHLQFSAALARLKVARHDLNGAEGVLQQAVRNAPQSAAAEVALAQLYLLRQSPAKAEEGIQRALHLEPRNEAALQTLAGIQLAAHRIDEAGQTYQKLAAFPGHKATHALFLYRQGKRDAALAEFEQLFKADPADRTVRTQLLQLYLGMNKLTAAQQLLGGILQKNPQDVDALLERSELYRRTGKVTEAAADLRTVLHFQPDSAAAHLGLAAVYRVQQLHKNENQELQEAVRLNPSGLQGRLLLARNFLLANDSKSALELLAATPEPQNKSVAFAVERNWALLSAGSFRELRSALDGALAHTRAPDFLLQDALLRSEERDYAGARRDAEELLRRNPEDLRAARVLAESYSAQDQTGKAVERLAKLAGEHSQSAPLQFLLGQWQNKLGRRAEARKAFEAAKSANGKFWDAEIALAALDQRENQLEPARQRLRAVISADSRNVSALLMLAGLEGYLGNRAAALTHFRAVLAIDPSNVVALNDAAYYLAQDDPDSALQLAQQAVEIAPVDPTVQETMGWVYYRKGNYSTAVTYLRMATSKSPTPQRQFHLAMAYLKAGNRDLGSQALNAALQKDPNLPKTEQGW